MKPRISVLMAAYNAEKYVAEAIDSILGQTYRDFEFIIINDGSTDKTAEIIKSYKDPRIVFVDNKKNQGLIAVLNQGLDMAKCEYLARMDADDTCVPDKFEKQIAFMDANPDVGILGTDYQAFGGNDTIFRCPEVIGFMELMKGNCISHPSVMIRKALFDKYDLRYDPDYVVAEDYELWSRAVRFMKIRSLPEIMCKYRWHETNVSNTGKELQLKNDARVKQNMLDFLTHDESLRTPLKEIIRGGRWAGIPIIKVRYRQNETVWRLFGIIPIRKRKK